MATTTTTFTKAWNTWANRASASYQDLNQPFGSSSEYSKTDNHPILAEMQAYEVEELDTGVSYMRFNDNTANQLIVKITQVTS